MDARFVLVGLAAVVLGCSANTLGTAMDERADDEASTESDTLASEGESGSGALDESTTTTAATDTGGSTEASDCPLGGEGCPCTGGGGCDAGLMCEAGLCVPIASDSSSSESTSEESTSESTTDTTESTTTESTTTDTGDPFMCELGQGCSNYDLATCTCEDCGTNGFCSQYEDCVCPDCTDENVCSGDNCTNDGACEPYYEGCSCSDCAGHPLCG